MPLPLFMLQKYLYQMKKTVTIMPNNNNFVPKQNEKALLLHQKHAPADIRAGRPECLSPTASGMFPEGD